MPDPDAVLPENSHSAVHPKRPWHPPLIEETDYSATEASPLPGVISGDGLIYSIVP